MEQTAHNEFLELYPRRSWFHTLQACAHFDEVLEIMIWEVFDKERSRWASFRIWSKEFARTHVESFDVRYNYPVSVSTSHAMGDFFTNLCSAVPTQHVAGYVWIPEPLVEKQKSILMAVTSNGLMPWVQLDGDQPVHPRFWYCLPLGSNLAHGVQDRA